MNKQYELDFTNWQEVLKERGSKKRTAVYHGGVRAEHNYWFMNFKQVKDFILELLNNESGKISGK